MWKMKLSRRKLFIAFLSISWLAAAICAAEDGSAERTGTGPVDYHHALPEADLLIDVGHGGIDGGAHYGDMLEKDINMEVARRLYLILKSYGIHAVMNRTGDYALSDDNRWHISRSRHRKDLSQRMKLSEEIQVKLLVSIHVNWSGSAQAHGPLVLHQQDGRSVLLAGFIQDALNRQQQLSRQPRHGKPYYLLRRVQLPAVIVETGFLSSPKDREMYKNPRELTRIALAIAAGLRQYMLVAE